MLFLAGPLAGQRVYEIPPGQTPPGFTLLPGDVINLREGGTLAYPYGSSLDPPGYSLPAGVVLNAFGGHATNNLTVGLGASANLYGGTIGDVFTAEFGSQVTLHGADFAIDGQPVAGLTSVGDQAAPLLANGQLLTGTLADGTPFAFSYLDWRVVQDSPYYSPYDPVPASIGDSFAYGALTLVQSETVAPSPGELTAQPNDPLRFISGDQSLTVSGLANLGDNFTAGVGSTLIIDGGGCLGSGCSPSVGENLEAIGATVELRGGLIAADADLFRGAQLTVTGGAVRQNLQVHRDAELLVQGGEVFAGLKIMPGGVATVTGGTLSATTAYPYYYSNTNLPVSVFGEGSLAIDGGQVQTPVDLFAGGRATQTAGTVTARMTLANGAEFVTSGGRFGQLTTNADSTVRLVGDQFSINGTPVADLDGVGDLQQVDIPAGAILTGVLADGRPFVVSPQDDSLAAGTLWLERSAPPTTGPAQITTPTDPAPGFVVDGQTVTVNAGGQLPDNFVAGRGSAVAVNSGSIGSNAEFAGAVVDVTGGGAIGSGAHAYQGAVVTVDDGRIGSGFVAYDGSVVDVVGGQVHSGFRALSGSQVTVRSGYLGSSFNAATGSSVELTGYNFKLDGAPIGGLMNDGDAIGVNVGEGQLLTGVLADGTSFALHADDGDHLSNGALTLRQTAAPAPGPSAINVPSDQPPAAIRDGQVLTLQTGGQMPGYFVAGDGSRLVINGGSLGNYSEAINAEVEVNGGEVGYGFSAVNSAVTLNGGEFAGTVDLFQGSSLIVNAGLMDSSVTAYRGARVEMQGGEIDGSLFVRTGAEAAITHAEITGDIHAYANSVVLVGSGSRVDGVSAYLGSQVTLTGGAYSDNISLSARSTLTLQGSDFRLNGSPIADLTALGGKLGDQDILTGVFADGTPFAFTERRGYSEDLSNGYVVLSHHAYTPDPGDYTPATLPNPLGVHASQSVTVSAGQTLGANFNAGYGSQVHISGGEVGENFEAAGAVVTLVGGQIADDADLLHGSSLTATDAVIGDDLFVAPTATIRLEGGELGDDASVFGVAEIVGGEVDRYFTVEAGGQATVTGGTFGDYLRVDHGGRLDLRDGVIGRYADLYGKAVVAGGSVDRGLDIQSTGELTIEGGSVGTDLQVSDDGRLRVFGGELADGVRALSGSSVELFAAQFTLDGAAIPGLTSAGDSLLLTERQGKLLELTFADGTTESFLLNESGSSSVDVFSSQAALTLYLVASEAWLAGDFNQDGVVDAADYTVWREHVGAAAGALPNDSTGAVIGDPQLELWRANYGATVATAAAIEQTPEPTSLLLLGVAAVAGLRRARRIAAPGR